MLVRFIVVRVRVIVRVGVRVIVRVRVPVIVRVCVPVIVRMLVILAHAQSFKIRCTAIAAPKPLSMFTTTTPDAQLVSIAKSGVKPPSAVP